MAIHLPPKSTHLLQAHLQQQHCSAMARFGFPSVLGAGALGAYGMQQVNNSGPSTLWGLLPRDWSLQQGEGGLLASKNTEVRAHAAVPGSDPETEREL